jgi:hypothetical protein
VPGGKREGGERRTLIVGPLLLLGIFLLFMSMREAAIVFEKRGWGRLPLARMHWGAAVAMAALAAAFVMRSAGYW